MKYKCKKQTTIAIIESDSGIFVGSNWQHNEVKECPRKDLKTGEGYELCKNICKQNSHAEIDVIRKAGPSAKGATLYLIGHYYACDDCKKAIEKAGIKKLIILQDKGNQNENS